MNTTPSIDISPPKRHLLWPILITSLIGIHVISVVTMVVVATHDSSFAVEPDSYQKGLHFEQTMEQRRENARLGWSVKLDVSQPLSGTDQRNVICRLYDRAGKPLEKAKVDLLAFAHVRASHTEPCTLLPQDPGQYVGTITFADPGMWEFRFVIAREKETFTTTVKREIDTAGAAGD